jgi:hypothetical protein
VRSQSESGASIAARRARMGVQKTIGAEVGSTFRANSAPLRSTPKRKAARDKGLAPMVEGHDPAVYDALMGAHSRATQAMPPMVPKPSVMDNTDAFSAKRKPTMPADYGGADGRAFHDKMKPDWIGAMPGNAVGKRAPTAADLYNDSVIQRSANAYDHRGVAETLRSYGYSADAARTKAKAIVKHAADSGGYRVAGVNAPKLSPAEQASRGGPAPPTPQNFFSYQAPPAPDFRDVPASAFKGTRKEWESMTPGMRREIARTHAKLGK